MISVKSIKHCYSNGNVLSFPDWEIADMDQWLLLGASGKGKSTLLNIISGLLKPTEGAVFIDQTNLYQLSPKAMDKFRGQKIGIVFQKPHLIKSLTVIENLELANTMAGCVVDKDFNTTLLADLGLAVKLKSYPDELSEGQLQRVSVARALVNKPDILIVDEPTSSLDDKNAETVIEMLTSQAKSNGTALIIATHDQRVRNYISQSYLL
ncbi:ABC transporter ATP-binding protein [Pedobacter aquatilis]|uniref:ABC transporter ATP-binding protein n=1 Tax=Pedobacter aquatilis TaxID=351343 RepID=UPI00292E92A9|nr:ATP-binding cassette domain-containing protein [Pedobacter aquatilis]